MVHERVLKSCIHFALLYTTDHIFPVIPIKYLINKDGDTTIPLKLPTGTKCFVSHLHVLFCPCVVQKATAHIDKKAFNMHHQMQKDFCSIFAGNPLCQKWELVYVPSTRKIISSYDVFFVENFIMS